MTLQNSIIEVQLNQRYHQAKERLAATQAEITNIEQLAAQNNVTLQTLTEDDLLLMGGIEQRERVKQRKIDEAKHLADIEAQIKADADKDKKKGGPQ
jgi:hypothetical protein